MHICHGSIAADEQYLGGTEWRVKKFPAMHNRFMDAIMQLVAAIPDLEMHTK